MDSDYLVFWREPSDHLVGMQRQNRSINLLGTQTKCPPGWAHFEIMGNFLRRKEAQFEWVVLIFACVFSENRQDQSCYFSWVAFLFCSCQHKKLGFKAPIHKVDACSTGTLGGCLCLWIFFFITYDNLIPVFSMEKSINLYSRVLPASSIHCSVATLLPSLAPLFNCSAHPQSFTLWDGNFWFSHFHFSNKLPS